MGLIINLQKRGKCKKDFKNASWRSLCDMSEHFGQKKTSC